MKKWMLMAGLLVLVMGCRNKTPQTSCVYGNDIAEATQDEIMQAGGRLIQEWENSEYPALYQDASQMLKRRQTREQFATLLRAADVSFGAKEFSRLEELYWMTSKAREEEAVIPCNLGAQGVQDLHMVPANHEVAALVYKSHGADETLRVVIHLLKEEGNWKLLSLAINASTAKGREAESYFKAARKSREKNLLHLAALQYRMAILLSELGPGVQEFTVSQIATEMQQIKADYLPQGSVQIWTMPSGHSYNVSNLSVISANNKIWVDVAYQAKSFTDTAGLEADGKELAKFLDQKFPEYREDFDGIVASAIGTTPADAYKLYRVIVPFDQLSPPSAAKP